jgi:hypothetical protein
MKKKSNVVNLEDARKKRDSKPQTFIFVTKRGASKMLTFLVSFKDLPKTMIIKDFLFKFDGYDENNIPMYREV